MHGHDMFAIAILALLAMLADEVYQRWLKRR